MHRILRTRASEWMVIVVLEKVPVRKITFNEFTHLRTSRLKSWLLVFPAPPTYPLPATTSSSNGSLPPVFVKSSPLARIRCPTPASFHGDLSSPLLSEWGAQKFKFKCVRARIHQARQWGRGYTQILFVGPAELRLWSKKCSSIQPEKLSLSCLFIYHESRERSAAVYGVAAVGWQTGCPRVFSKWTRAGGWVKE